MSNRNLSVNLFTPLWMGRNYLSTISSSYDSLRFSSRAIGGYWDGAFSIRSDWDTMMWWMSNGLGCHVEIKDESLSIVWEGFVDKVEVTSGPLSVSVGPLLDMANRVIVDYSELDTTIEPGIPGNRVETDPADDFDSQARYGILERVESTGPTTADIADQLRDLCLQRYAWPQPTIDISTTNHEQNIIVTLKGYVHFLDKTRYRQIADGGFVSLEEKVASAVLAENNDLFDINTAFQMKEVCKNGSFEESGAGGTDLFADWVESAGDGTISRITTDNKTGKVCLGLTAGASKNTHVYQDITVTPEKAYVLTFWVRDLSTDTVSTVHTGSDNSTYLTASGSNFKADKVKVGQTLNNTTDGSSGTITKVDKNRIWVNALTGGTENDFDNGDVCTIVVLANPGRFKLYDVTNSADILSLRDTTQYGSDRWHRIRHVFYAPTGCSSVRLYLYCPGTNGKQSYFDAVSIREYNVELGERGTYVPAYEDGEQSCWTIIKELVRVGDWENKQYLFGVYSDRQVRFELAPEVVEYYFAPFSHDQRYYNRGGAVVNEWSIQPGKWLALSGFMIGQPIDLNRYTDPRITFIEEVRFSLDLGLTINTSRMNKFQHLLAKAGLKMEE